jgi:hypothetical protein
VRKQAREETKSEKERASDEGIKREQERKGINERKNVESK